MNETRSMRAGLSCSRPKPRHLVLIGMVMATWSLPTMASTAVFSTVGDLIGNSAGSFAMDTYHFNLSSLAPSYTATLTDTGMFGGADQIGMSVLGPSMKLLGTQMGSGSFNFTANELGSYTLVVAGKPKAPSNFDVFGASVVDPTPVPEVNTWLMLLVGLGMMGFRLHRRRGEAAYPV